MKKINYENTRFLILVHLAFKKGNVPAEGPYSSVIRSLPKNSASVEIIGLPLTGYNNPIIYGEYSNYKKLMLPKLLGKIPAAKYLLDIFISFVLLIKSLFDAPDVDTVVIAADPLAAIPALMLKPFSTYKLVFYSVDFSEHRFESNLLQKAYELADALASKFSDQVWAVCYSLIDYKKKHYNVDAIYIPNSFPYISKYYDERGVRSKKKVVWTGSVSTPKQLQDVVKVSKSLQTHRPDLEFWFIPTYDSEELAKAIKKHKLINAQVFDVAGQEESRNLVKKCDLGLAIYDKDFGSTKYIEPIKIWEYMMCGLPFIISCEASLNPDLLQNGVALQLLANNQVPASKELKSFISVSNLRAKSSLAMAMAIKYDSSVLIKDALGKLVF